MPSARFDWLAPRLGFAVLVLLGFGLLVNPAVPGIHIGEGTVHRYEAARVTYDGANGLQATDVSTGRELHGLDVDDDITCEEHAATARRCQFEYAILSGTSVPASLPEGFQSARYQYVYLNDTFYEPTVTTTDGESYLALEPESDADPLANVAMQGDFSEPVQAAIAGEQVLVHDELAVANRLIRYEGAYYTIYRSAHKRYGSRGSFCASNGEGFCDEAGVKRWVDTLLTLGSRVLGAVLLVAAFRLRWEARGE